MLDISIVFTIIFSFIICLCEQNLGIYRCLQFIRSFNGRPSPRDLDFGHKYEPNGDGLIHINKGENTILPSANTALQRRFIVDRSGHTSIEIQ